MRDMEAVHKGEEHHSLLWYCLSGLFHRSETEPRFPQAQQVQARNGNSTHPQFFFQNQAEMDTYMKELEE